MTELKTCPFCGGETEWWRQFGWDRKPLGYVAGCCSCGIQTWICDTKELAIAAWNTRACDECERGAIPATEENMAEHGWVKVVRCKDCRFYEKGYTRWWCVKSITLVPEPDCFCAWGRRKVVEK